MKKEVKNQLQTTLKKLASELKKLTKEASSKPTGLYIDLKELKELSYGKSG